MTRQEKEDLLREAVETLIKLDNHMMTSRDNAEFSQWVEDLIEQPQQRTGHWKRISMDKYVQHAMAYYRCSECDKDIIGEHNYCPNCGAKMKEGD